MKSLRLFLLLTAFCLLTSSDAFVPVAFERSPSWLLSRTRTTPDREEFARRGGLVTQPKIHPHCCHPGRIASRVFSAVSDDDTHDPEEIPAAVERGRGSHPEAARSRPSLLLRLASSWRSFVSKRRLRKWVSSLSLSSKPLWLRENIRGGGLSRVRETTKRIVPALLLAFLIWHRAPSGLETPTIAGHPRSTTTSTSRVAYASSSTNGKSNSQRPGNWMTRVIPGLKSSSISTGTTGSLKAASTSTPTASSTSTLLAKTTSKRGGGERSSVKSSLASVVLTTTTVATVGAGTTTIVLKRSKEARRFLERQQELRRAFQSNLKRVVRHSFNSDEQGDNLIMAKRFQFLRAKKDRSDNDRDDAYEDYDFHGDAGLHAAGDEDAAHSSPDAAARQQHRLSSNQLQQKRKSEQDYIQELLNRVKQNVAVPSMRRTEKSIAARAAELHPHEDNDDDGDGSAASKQPGAASSSSNAHTVVQSLKSISSLSTSTVDGGDDDMEDEPMGTGSASLEAALEIQTLEEALSLTATGRVFLHDVDAAYALAFDSADSTSKGEGYMHDMDEAYALAFEAVASLLEESTVPMAAEGEPSNTAVASLHQVDDAFAHAFGQVDASPLGLPTTEEATGPTSDISDLSLISGEIAAAVWKDNIDSEDLEISDVVYQFAVVEDEAAAPSFLKATSTAVLEQAAIQVDTDTLVSGPVAVEDVTGQAPSRIAPNIRVIVSLESLVESPDRGVASAAADVLTEVEAASNLADEIKRVRKSIDTTATTVDDDEVDDSETGASAQSVAVDIPSADADIQGHVDSHSSDTILESSSTPAEAEIEPSVLKHDVFDEPTSELLSSNEVETSDTEEGNGIAVPSLSTDEGQPLHLPVELKIGLQSEESVVYDATGHSTAPDETVVAASSLANVANVAGPNDAAPVALPVVSADDKDSDTATADSGSSPGDTAEIVGAFPAWIRERVRSKRQSQRDRSRAKKSKEGHELDSKSARDAGIAEVDSAVVMSTATHVPREEKSDVPLQEAVSKQSPIKLFASVPVMKEKRSDVEHSASHSQLRSGKKNRRNRKVRQVPQNSAEAEALSRKYAAIPTVEERAFTILKDLGMLEPLDDSEG